MEYDFIRENLQAGTYSNIQKLLPECSPVDLAHTLEELDHKEMMMAFRLMPKDQAAEVFTYLEPDLAQSIVKTISEKEMGDLIDRMFIDDAVDLLEELPANMVRAILNHTDKDTRRTINRFLKYPENSAGSIMTVEYVALFETMNCADALAYIRHSGLDKETIYTCYSTDSSRHLTGAVSLRNILLADDDDLIIDIAKTTINSVNTWDDQEEVAKMFQEYDLIAMPVVDKENRIVGIITIDDVVDVIEAENTEDFEKMAALNPSEAEYLRTNVWDMARNRILWLLIMMLSATLSGAIIKNFETTLSQVVSLAAFIPMLMGTGGNCGAQASTLIIRGMAVGDIEPADWLRVIWKEIRVGALVGIGLSAINLARIIIFTNSSWQIQTIVTVTLFFTVFFAKVMGCTLPLIAKACKVDPALMATPLISTIVDAITLVIYFTVATAIISKFPIA